MARIESNPSAGGKLVIKSIEQWEKGCVIKDPSVGIKVGFDGFRSILNC